MNIKRLLTVMLISILTFCIAPAITLAGGADDGSVNNQSQSQYQSQGDNINNNNIVNNSSAVTGDSSASATVGGSKVKIPLGVANLLRAVDFAEKPHPEVNRFFWNAKTALCEDARTIWTNGEVRTCLDNTGVLGLGWKNFAFVDNYKVVSTITRKHKAKKKDEATLSIDLSKYQNPYQVVEDTECMFEKFGAINVTGCRDEAVSRLITAKAMETARELGADIVLYAEEGIKPAINAKSTTAGVAGTAGGMGGSITAGITVAEGTTMEVGIPGGVYYLYKALSEEEIAARQKAKLTQEEAEIKQAVARLQAEAERKARIEAALAKCDLTGLTPEQIKTLRARFGVAKTETPTPAAKSATPSAKTTAEPTELKKAG